MQQIFFLVIKKRAVYFAVVILAQDINDNYSTKTKIYLVIMVFIEALLVNYNK